VSKRFEDTYHLYCFVRLSLRVGQASCRMRASCWAATGQAPILITFPTKTALPLRSSKQTPCLLRPPRPRLHHRRGGRRPPPVPRAQRSGLYPAPPTSLASISLSPTAIGPIFATNVVKSLYAVLGKNTRFGRKAVLLLQQKNAPCYLAWPHQLS
jgi:hypothetical protein